MIGGFFKKGILTASLVLGLSCTSVWASGEPFTSGKSVLTHPVNAERIYAHDVYRGHGRTELLRCAWKDDRVISGDCEGFSGDKVTVFHLQPVSNWKMRSDLVLMMIISDGVADEIAGKRPCLDACGVPEKVFHGHDGYVLKVGSGWYEPDERLKGMFARMMLYANAWYGYPLSEPHAVRKYAAKYPPTSLEMVKCNRIRMVQGQCVIDMPPESESGAF